MYRLLSFLTAIFLISFTATTARASYNAVCNFEVEVLEMGTTIRTLGGLVTFRTVKGKITKAETIKGSYIDCEKKFLKEEVAFSLLLKAGGMKRDLASFKVGDTIKVEHRASGGLTPWGAEEEEDWWFVK